MNFLDAKVVAATSWNENHPAESITDGNTETFWMTTGLFPQEVTIRVEQPGTLSAVTVDSYNVKHLKIETNTSEKLSHFQAVTEKEFERTEGHLQSNHISLNGVRAIHLRLIIASGYDHFISVHRVRLRSCVAD